MHASGLVWCVALLTSAYAAAEQHVFSAQSERPLSGRFLHITDMHVDGYYRENAAVVSQCHRDAPHKKHGGHWRAGYWGTPVSDCDSPLRLANSTLQWLQQAWQPEPSDAYEGVPAAPFDFILWTGDSARHEQDAVLPRSAKEIADLNRYTVDLFEHYFPNVPLVPNIGNNDIQLHNTMPGGPSQELTEFSNIWQKHIPANQREAFLRGGYFAKDVIPDKLGVISLNTLYFYDSNKAVDGCPRRRRRQKDSQVDPGTLQLEWLAERLIEFRRRNMQVHLVGHVPPTAGNYFGRCFDVYTELVLRFQDTIVGQHFGHMNLDAFFVQESAVASRKHPRPKIPIVFKQIEEDLRYDYESLPGNARTNMDLYGVFYEAPSIVPTYLPSLRVWTYNTSLEHGYRPVSIKEDTKDLATLLDYVSYNLCDDDEESEECESYPPPRDVSVYKKDRQHNRPSRRRRHRRRDAKLPRYASPWSPSRSNTFLTPLGYSQWVLDLDAANANVLHQRKMHAGKLPMNLTLEFDLEYTTYTAPVLWHQFQDELISPSEIMPPPHHHETPGDHHIPVPYALLQRTLSQLDLTSPFNCDKDLCRLAKPVKTFTNYHRDDMTLRSVMDLARRLVVDKKLWKTYVHRMYTNSLKN
ncbi:endopolyphosphatase [Malassezia nana]|uniref:Endopolyphosphatase n=1 Tax=Malassezia nana TaxID=180528 RepID=A0AAF0J429_9BASI|nr:endopolyphosphatase [Malassezia nana]